MTVLLADTFLRLGNHMTRHKACAPNALFAPLLAVALAWAGAFAPARAEAIAEDVAVTEDGTAIGGEANGGAGLVAEGEASVADGESDSYELVTETYHLDLFQDEAPRETTRPTWSPASSALSAQATETINELIAKCLDAYATTIDISSFNLTPEGALQAYQTFVNENPRYFYVSSAASCTSEVLPEGQHAIEIEPAYSYSVSKIPAMKVKYEKAMKEILSWVPSGAGDAVKAKVVHDWLVRNCAYNNEAAQLGFTAYTGGSDPWNAYGALVTKSPVCQGYALAYIDALTRLGVECEFVANESVGHAWNRVRVKGHWYHTDVTWDDPIWEGKGDAGFDADVLATYFLKSDSWMIADAKNDSLHTHSTWSPAGTASDDKSYDTKTNWPTYSGPAESSYKTSIAKATVTLSKSAFTYNGKTQRPTVTVKVGTKKLTSGSDYSVKYGNIVSKAAGTYKITITGKGNYTGKKVVSYTIKKAASSIKIARQTKSYTGAKIAYSGKVTKTGSAGLVTFSYYSNAAGTKAVRASAVKAVGVYYVRASLAADANHKAAKSNVVTLKIVKGANTLTVKAAKRTVKSATLAKKAVTVASPAKVSKAKGKVTYKSVAWKTSNKKKASQYASLNKMNAQYLKVNAKTGKVTVKKGAPKGTYKLRIKVTAKGSKSYKSASKTVTCIIVVK